MSETSLWENVYGACAVGISLLFSPVIRGWYNRWGATDDEINAALPGDDLAPHVRLGYTRAITINAPAATVWKWLIQIGQGRGGLYSYEGLENLIGCDMHNAETIVPALQHLKAGDFVRLGPPGYPQYKVVEVCPTHRLILTGADPKTGETLDCSRPLPPVYTISNWVFVLKQCKDGSTRLIVRSRLDYNPTVMNDLLWHLMEPINFVMERKMLLGIKQRAETLFVPTSYQQAV